MGLGIDLHIGVVRVVAPLAGLLALLTLSNHHPTLRHEGVVKLVRIWRQHVLMQADRGVGAFGELGVERQDLVVAGEKGLVEALVVRIALLDVAKVPLAVKRGGIASLGEDLGHRHFFSAHAVAL